MASLDFVGLLANRYITAVSATISVWDHLITLDKECQAVWVYRSDHLVLRMGYMLTRSGRYGPLESINVRFLQAEITTSAHENLIDAERGSGLSPGLVGARISTLWEHRRPFRYFVFAVAIVFVCACAITETFHAIQVSSNVVYLPYEPVSLEVCIMTRKFFVNAWTVGLIAAFDLFLVLMTLFNALSIPRTDDWDIIRQLNRDGIHSFLGLSALLLVALGVIIRGSVAASYAVLPPVWAFTSVITSRLFYQINISKKQHPKVHRIRFDSVDSDFSLPIQTIDIKRLKKSPSSIFAA
ncbi:hypothetical protein NP233_g10609 [Leucocoprinus birnbaumii]|uniref:DUF6533 domain-containing protein n=1 Tax=Leucocoprinus birnbaumii TaxID=56174 RepID=A0AAD5VHZ3_9AGAR|nr:hypothetical protein NP233_g10609 [Leucocoprinus birnbaumii]